MKIVRFDDTYFVYIAGKVFFVPALSKFTRRIKWAFIHVIFNIREDIDCDGTSVTYTDKLTDGKIYYWNAWNYSRVGGSRGICTTFFDKWSIYK